MERRTHDLRTNCTDIELGLVIRLEKNGFDDGGKPVELSGSEFLMRPWSVRPCDGFWPDRLSGTLLPRSRSFWWVKDLLKRPWVFTCL